MDFYLNNVDFFFFYKYFIRFFFFLRYSTLKMPLIYKVVLYFSVKSINDVNDQRIYNYIYFFRFFFGFNAFISKQKFFFLIINEFLILMYLFVWLIIDCMQPCFIFWTMFFDICQFTNGIIFRFLILLAVIGFLWSTWICLVNVKPIWGCLV